MTVDAGAAMEAVDDRDAPIRPSSRVGRFRHDTVAGAVLAGVAIGLRDVFDPVTDEDPPVVADWSGDPPAPRPVEVTLDLDDPAASSVLVRADHFGPADPSRSTPR